MITAHMARFSAITLLAAALSSGTANAAVVPPADLLPLNQIAVPEPPNLFQFVKNKPAAIKLGKALFWDMQAGSDGVQACASCHFSAGADNRTKNTVNPGTQAGDTTFQVRGPNETLQPADFPFHQRQNRDFQGSAVIRDSNDVVGSQGVRFSDFVNIVLDASVDNGSPIPDPVFQVNGVNTRRVTSRNTPTNINAVFNFNNFWDGRAHFTFNGVNPFGPLDTGAGVWFNQNQTLVKQPVAIEFASLASQATGPPLDDTEMSFRGRTFPDLGRKMLRLTPLGQQLVHPRDSVLGPLSRAVLLPNGKIGGSKGLSVTYRELIQDAFQDNLWNSLQLTPGGFSQMEANFSLFWGLAIQLYEATLVADQTPFDRFLGGDQNALTPQQQEGFTIFFGAGRCNFCHTGSEQTNASVRAAAFVSNAANAVIEQMAVASGDETIYDTGYNNTAITRTSDDIGRGGTAPFVNQLTGQFFPLSFSFLAELQAAGNLPFATPLLPPRLPSNFPVSNHGAFKVPGLRNVELTAPYFHNGSVMTLEDVVAFYVRGGNFPAANSSDLDVNIDQIGSLQNAPAKQASLVAFLKSMTDERVRKEAAPFDHPELFIPNGDPEVMIKIPAKDANGIAAPSIAVALDPPTTPTRLPSQTISGTKEPGASVQVQLNDGLQLPADTTTDTTWNHTITGLVEGTNTITVTAVDLASVSSTITGTITLDTTAPQLTINPVASPSRGGGQILSGTVESGIIPAVILSTTAVVSPVTVNGTTWSCQLSGLVKGANGITVTAVDPLGNVTVKTASITVIFSDGDFTGKGNVDITDAVKSLRIALGLIQPTGEEMMHGDVAPLVNGAPAPDGKMDIADALVILRKAVGLINF
jgi:cytochrome c peroxidase